MNIVINSQAGCESSVRSVLAFCSSSVYVTLSLDGGLYSRKQVADT